jgi:hypothetical protein
VPDSTTLVMRIYSELSSAAAANGTKEKSARAAVRAIVVFMGKQFKNED